MLYTMNKKIYTIQYICSMHSVVSHLCFNTHLRIIVRDEKRFEQMEQVNPKTLICLAMIVKEDDEDIMKRCLTSIAPFIDAYSICDTGSPNRTKEVIVETANLLGINGVLHNHKWENFGYNRTLSMIESRKRCPLGWSLVTDADDLMEGKPLTKEFLESVPDDITHIRICTYYNGFVEYRPRMFRNTYNWSYKMRVHEYPHCSTPVKYLDIPESQLKHIASSSGTRSKDPLRYIKDASMLAQDYKDDPSNLRALFYLAESYRWSELNKEASKYYKLRIDASGGIGDRDGYFSCIEMIKIYSGKPVKATNAAKRHEYAWKALHMNNVALDAAYYAMHEDMEDGAMTYETLAIGMSINNPTREIPTNGLYNKEIYNWKFDDTLSVIITYVGLKKDYDTMITCAIRALQKCPDSHRERILKNITYGKQCMQ